MRKTIKKLFLSLKSLFSRKAHVSNHIPLPQSPLQRPQVPRWIEFPPMGWDTSIGAPTLHRPTSMNPPIKGPALDDVELLFSPKILPVTCPKCSNFFSVLEPDAEDVVFCTNPECNESIEVDDPIEELLTDSQGQGTSIERLTQEYRTVHEMLQRNQRRMRESPYDFLATYVYGNYGNN